MLLLLLKRWPEDNTGFSLECSWKAEASGATWEMEQSEFNFLHCSQRSESSVMEENGLYFNYFCSVIPIYQPVIQLRDWLTTWYFLKPKWPFYSVKILSNTLRYFLTEIEMFCLFWVNSNIIYRQKEQHPHGLCVKRSDDTQQADDLYWKYITI